MAERLRSKDGVKETETFTDGHPETGGQQGREGGNTARKVGTRAEQKSVDGEAKSRVTGIDERGSDVVENR